MAIKGGGRGVSLIKNNSIQPVSGGLLVTACLARIKAIIVVTSIAVKPNYLKTHQLELTE